MKFLEVHESQEFQQNENFMKDAAMMESAADNNLPGTEEKKKLSIK